MLADVAGTGRGCLSGQILVGLGIVGWSIAELEFADLSNFVVAELGNFVVAEQDSFDLAERGSFDLAGLGSFDPVGQGSSDLGWLGIVARLMPVGWGSLEPVGWHIAD